MVAPGELPATSEMFSPFRQGPGIASLVVRATRPVARTEPLPRFVAPMLLESGRPAAAGDGSWAVEVKFDGIRAQLRVDGGRGWRMRSRPGRNCTAEFPELAALANALKPHEVGRRGGHRFLGLSRPSSKAACPRYVIPKPPRTECPDRNPRPGRSPRPYFHARFRYREAR
jgi:hypothetical protein